ncbi:glycogen debranching N-terminal domain-containing protein [Microbacterium fluvii]|uniref:Glycogen debranching N-terminal domain-containing protein n=1 Tax=Microbacterium fluvii TaxID=415215 RepID=A0ABW2HBX9_9MICO|nr:glycogen debranching N-terminal domain-containing protein [Microbacterium fluvii]MCU4672461.1 amylo-alpha-1,6-glucosidase [Microbacterium fluvii]
MSAPRQPFLTDAIMTLHAPTQVWSARDGDLGTGAIEGIYHGDTRFAHVVELTSAGAHPEVISTASPAASRLKVEAVLRDVDGDQPDPQVRLSRDRTVGDGLVRERITVRSHRDAEMRVALELRLVPEFAPLQEVKAGAPAPREWTAEVGDGLVTVTGTGSRMTLSAPAARLSASGAVRAEWMLVCPARGELSVEWAIALHDPSLVVRGAPPAGWEAELAPEADPRLRLWVRRALSDLEALRLVLPAHPDDVFVGAGAPWFLTLFGRDSLWAARLLLPLDARLAASTLRVLARLQGTTHAPERAEAPGKILHELRAGALELPGEGVVLPPLYYGTVDATPLWVCLLAEAAERGMPDDEVRALLPALRAALDWMLESAGDDGFLDYVDETGHGLSNQGWKDSGDSIQWRDGTLAAGPIALCEVQGYAYEAAVEGARLLERFDEPGVARLRAWAAGLRARFAERFWVTTPEGTYPAIALDRDGSAVDTLTSNIGHLLGTGILDADQERAVAGLLVGPTMSSGFGVRTMSTAAAGYWPLSYHGGSVWAHDSAIVAHGMARAGCRAEAAAVVAGLLAAAEAFDYRMPELHAGDSDADAPVPAPYPAACRPQAWSAAAAVTCWDVSRE